MQLIPVIQEEGALWPRLRFEINLGRRRIEAKLFWEVAVGITAGAMLAIIKKLIERVLCPDAGLCIQRAR